MKKRLIAALSIALLLGACGDKAPAPAPAPGETATEAVTRQEAEPGTEETAAAETEAEETAPEVTKIENVSLAEVRDRLQARGAAAGIAYVAYVGEDMVPVTEYAAADSMSVTYPFIREIPETRAAYMGGTEAYLVVPGEDITEVGVYYYNEGDNEKTGEAVYQASGNEPFLVVCNVYDQGPNTIIELKRGDEVALSYVPCLAAAILQKADGVVDIGLPENVYAFDNFAPLTVDGEPLEMMFTSQEEGEGGPIQLAYKGQTVELKEFADYLRTGYVVDTEDGFYVLVQAGYSNDWTNTVPVRYTPDRGLVVLDTVEGAVADRSALTLDHLVIRSRVDCFGTYGTYVPYAMKDGQLVPQTTYLDFRNEPDPYFAALAGDPEVDEYVRQCYTREGYCCLITGTSFEAVAEDGSAVTVPAEATILPRGVEPETNTFFFTWEEQTLSVVYEHNTEDYDWKINGVSQEDLFLVTPYSG